MNEKEYPYNLIRKVIGPDKSIDDIWLSKFNELVHYILTNRESTVLHLYYCKGLILKDVASQLNLSVQRISQIRDKAIRKLKAKEHEYYIPTMVEKYEAQIENLTDQNRYIMQKEHVNNVPYAGKDINVMSLGFTVRTYNCLKRSDVNWLSEITKLTENDLCKIRNMGKRSVQEVKDKLAEYGLSLKEED